MILLKSPLKIVVFLIIAFVIINNYIFIPNNILGWDIFGYYLYLPFSFIYGDITIQNIDALKSIVDVYNNTNTLYQIFPLAEGGHVMKYTMGWSVVYMPYFFIGHIIAVFTEYPSDGFSAPYQISIFIGSIIYTIAGIWFLSKILNHFFKSHISAIVLILIVFGTNYLLHNTMYGQNSMSHNVLFTFYTIVVWSTIQWYKSHKVKHVLLLGIICGLMILTRPTEIVCLLIPLLWPHNSISSFKERISFFKTHKTHIILFGVAVILIGLPQLIYWKSITGQFLYSDYGNPGEGLDFLSPHTLDVLFSFRKGWFIYTPLMLIATIGFITLYRKNKAYFLPLFTFFILNLYLVSSWSCWWYASSFSQRALIPSMVIMAIPLGYLIQRSLQFKTVIKTSFFILLGLLLFLNVFQTVQFHKGVLPGDRITKDYYFEVFGKLSVDAKTKEDLLLINRSFNGKETLTNEEKYKKRIIHRNEYEEEGNNSEYVYSGSYSFRLDSTKIYSEPYVIPFKELTASDHAWIRVKAMIYPTKPTEENPTSLFISFQYKGKSYKWRDFSTSLNPLPANEWSEISLEYLTPEVRTKNDNLVIGFWHRGKHSVYVDHLVVEVFEPK